MIYPIIKYGNPVLETPCATVADAEFGTAELREFVASMFDTMYAAKGVGLAAPQVARSIRLTVIDTSAGEDPERKLVLINPEIVSAEGKQKGEEGCLSIPGFREEVVRAKKCVVQARDAEGAAFEVAGEDLLARAFQHEIDHLNGKLFLSHLSALKRDLIRRQIRKLAKAGEWT